MQQSTNDTESQLDFVTILLYLLLVAAGFMCIYSSSHGTEGFKLNLETNYGKEIIWIVVSLVMGGLLFLIDARFFEVFSYAIYGICMGLLILVIFLGKEVNGARSWFELGGFRLQPAEFAKFGVSLALARYIGDMDVNLKRRRFQIITTGMIVLPILLIVLQGDAGSGLVFLSLLLVLYREGLSGAVLVIGLVALVLGVLTIAQGGTAVVIGVLAIIAVIVGFTYTNKAFLRKLALIAGSVVVYVVMVQIFFDKVLEPHQQIRIEVMLGLKEDPQGWGYNVNQSMIAIGSGGFLGKGYLKGTQTKGDFVPEQHTDFIFTSVGEEFGWVGTSAVVVLFVLLLLRIVHLAERQKNKFSRIYAYCVFSMLFFHVLINIGMTINLAPVIGIPLPFFSYGGSSMISFSLLLLLMVRLDANRGNELDSINY
ncbi:MAG: rod shape-determining protein RodA [Bacteroidetes bacterium]|nr:rod shape-determining protein RodA [Bacteroidota bacterium]